MNTAQINAMLHAARDLLRHAGVETDSHTVRWAQTLVAANPRDKISNMRQRNTPDPSSKIGQAISAVRGAGGSVTGPQLQRILLQIADSKDQAGHIRHELLKRGFISRPVISLTDRAYARLSE